MTVTRAFLDPSTADVRGLTALALIVVVSALPARAEPPPLTGPVARLAHENIFRDCAPRDPAVTDAALLAVVTHADAELARRDPRVVVVCRQRASGHHAVLVASSSRDPWVEDVGAAGVVAASGGGASTLLSFFRFAGYAGVGSETSIEDAERALITAKAALERHGCRREDLRQVGSPDALHVSEQWANGTALLAVRCGRRDTAVRSTWETTAFVARPGAGTWRVARVVSVETWD